MATLKLVPRPQFFLSYFITPCHSLSHLITTYALGWKKNQFNLETLKLVPRSLISFHILSRLSTPYHTLSPRLETKPFQLTNVKVDPRLQLFYHISSHFFTSYHTLSHLISHYPLGCKQNQFHLSILKLVPGPLISHHNLSRLVTPDHTLSHVMH